MEAEGITFKCNVNVGVDITGEELTAKYDAVVLSGGAEKPRDLPIPGRDLHGVHFAMDFLPQQNRRVSHEVVLSNDAILASGKHVVVIGGGDTGSDCIGTSIRQGALSVTQLEIMPEPPVKENKMLTWPDWPLKLRTSSSHQEGAKRDFAVLSKHFEGDKDGNVKALHCVRVDDKMGEVEGSAFALRADLVLLAMGFVSPIPRGSADGVGRRARQARQRRRRPEELRLLGGQGLGLRRHASRPEPGRLGDPGRPPGGSRRRQGADGRDRAAAIGA